jgi:hypothetical protein
MIPEQLRDLDLIRICSPDCDAHISCKSPGKRPVYSVDDVRSISEITDWVENGGNVGVVATDDLVIVDTDTDPAESIVEQHLPETFTVRTGSGNRIYYLRCSEWDRNVAVAVDDEEHGSIRANGWQAVAPPSLHPSGDRYAVLRDQSIVSVDRGLLEAAEADLSDLIDVKSGGRPAAAPSSHAVRDIQGLEFVKRDDIRADLADVLATKNPSHNRRIWLVGWLYSTAGLPTSEIVDLVIDEARWDNLDRETTRKQVESVIRSSDSGKGTHYSNYSGGDEDTAYKSERSDERRKTEFSGGDSMAEEAPEFTVKERVNILEAENDGDSFRDVTLVEGNDDGETFEFVQLRKGRVEMQETLEHGEVKALNVYDRKSLGSPEYIDDLIEGLSELEANLNGDE